MTWVNRQYTNPHRVANAVAGLCHWGMDLSSSLARVFVWFLVAALGILLPVAMVAWVVWPGLTP